jgi:hypothetical protein
MNGKASQSGKRALLREPLVWRLDPTHSNLAGINLDALVPEAAPDGEAPVHRTARVRDRSGTAELTFVPYADPAGTKMWFRKPDGTEP